MSARRFWLMVLFLGAMAALGWWSFPSSPSGEKIFEPPSETIEPLPLVPWRESESDRPNFFPGSTSHRSEMRILSGQRVELQKKLGRLPAADESSLHYHRIFQQDHEVGTVLTRNVRGEHGAIEIVLALDSRGTIAGLKLQRCREPETQTAVLHRPEWLGAFMGKTARDGLEPGVDLPEPGGGAEQSARGIAAAVRSLLILYETAMASGLKTD